MLQTHAEMSHPAGAPASAVPAPPSTEERILDATLAVLAREGGRRLSMTAVAETAGVSRMTLYRYYPAKDDLLRALARHEQRRFDERLTAVIAAATTPIARIDAVLRAIAASLDDEAARALVQAEPGFVVDRLRRSLPVQRATIERLISDALTGVPAVRTGAATPRDVADLILRVAMSHFLLPDPDPGALLRALRAAVGTPRPARGGRRGTR